MKHKQLLNLKYILFFICISHFSFLISHFPIAHAANPTAAPTPPPVQKAVSENLDKQINQLKDKIASRVSELNLVEKRGMIGTVNEVKGNQITLSDAAGNTRFVDVDEITKFSSTGTRGSYGLSDITKGSKISVLGIYNKQSKRLLARFIKTHADATIQSGKISAIDPRNFQLTVLLPEQKIIKVDVDTTTKINSYTKADGLAKYGFSRLAVGDRITVAGFPDRTDATLLAASRIIDFIDLPKDPRIVEAANTVVSSPSATLAVPTVANTKRINPVR